MSGLSDILRNAAGNFEITRTLGAIGVLTFIVGAHVFEAIEIFVRHQHFDLVAYCTAFPSGLAIAVGVVATAAGIKDRNVAQANATAQQGGQA